MLHPDFFFIPHAAVWLIESRQKRVPSLQLFRLFLCTENEKHTTFIFSWSHRKLSSLAFQTKFPTSPNHLINSPITKTLNQEIYFFIFSSLSFVIINIGNYYRLI